MFEFEKFAWFRQTELPSVSSIDHVRICLRLVLVAITQGQRDEKLKYIIPTVIPQLEIPYSQPGRTWTRKLEGDGWQVIRLRLPEEINESLRGTKRGSGEL